MSSMVMLQLRMMDLCFNRQNSGPRTRAVLLPLSLVVAACVVCGCANAYETSRGSYGGLYSSENERGRLFTVVQLTAQFMSNLILTLLFFYSMRACRRQLLVRSAVSIQVPRAAASSVLRFCRNRVTQRSAFASSDTLTAQLEIETGLRVRLRQQRVMRAGNYVMVMYTIRAAYTLLILIGFARKRARPEDPTSECRQFPCAVQ